MLINVKMPTNSGILTFINMMNTTSEFESKSMIFSAFRLYEQFRCHAQLS